MLLAARSVGLKCCSAALILAMAQGCVSQTLINSRPGGARVTVDGRYIGEAPATYSETVTATTRNSVQLQLAGYKDGMGFIAADQWTGSKVAGSVILGLTCLPLIGFVGLIWSTDYKPTYEFLLEPDVGTAPGYGVPMAPGTGYAPLPPGSPPQPQYQPQDRAAPPQYQPAPQQPAPQPGPPAYQPQPLPPSGGAPTPPPPPPPLRKFDPDGLRRGR